MLEQWDRHNSRGDPHLPLLGGSRRRVAHRAARKTLNQALLFLPQISPPQGCSGGLRLSVGPGPLPWACLAAFHVAYQSLPSPRLEPSTQQQQPLRGHGHGSRCGLWLEGQSFHSPLFSSVVQGAPDLVGQ